MKCLTANSIVECVGSMTHVLKRVFVSIAMSILLTTPGVLSLVDFGRVLQRSQHRREVVRAVVAYLVNKERWCAVDTASHAPGGQRTHSCSWVTWR